MEIDILNTASLSDIPGASGIVPCKYGYLIIGDNSPFIHLTDQHFQTVSKYRIFDSKEAIIPKPIKPDFEAMEQVGPNEILIFGSGSLTPERDILIRFNPDNPEGYESHNVSGFYHALRRFLPADSELNIEALAYRNDTLYLFNRFPATILVIRYADLTRYLTNGTIPDIKVYPIELPAVNGISAGFSGATIPEGCPFILFTASAEDTDNAYDDGEIRGSILGTIALINDEPAEKYTHTDIPSEIPLKIEGICTEPTENDSFLDVTLISDSDGAGSLALKCLLQI